MRAWWSRTTLISARWFLDVSVASVDQPTSSVATSGVRSLFSVARMIGHGGELRAGRRLGRPGLAMCCRPLQGAWRGRVCRRRCRDVHEPGGSAARPAGHGALLGRLAGSLVEQCTANVGRGDLPWAGWQGSSRYGCAQHLGREAAEQTVGGEAVAELGVGGELASDQLADRPRVCALCVVGRRTEARGLMQGQQAARIPGDRRIGWDEVPGLASSRARGERRC